MPRSFETPAVITDDRPTPDGPGTTPASDVVVMKFGGTSVADADRIRAVARRAVDAHRAGRRVVVVASAMGRSTDQLIELAREVTSGSHEREMDMLLSVGERISCSLIAMAITDLGCEAVSLTGSQAGIVTDTAHGRAKIVDIRAHRLHEALDAGRIVLVAGFQGVSTERDVTTLGRGGSDATAVALAAALGAHSCEIYTDVDGVYTADPRVVPGARKLHFVSYEEMLEMSGHGARVLMMRSVEFARNYSVRLHVRSSFVDEPGTWIGEEDERMEKAIISGVVHDSSQAMLVVAGVPAGAGGVARLFAQLAAREVNVDLLLRAPAGGEGGSIVFTVPEGDLPRAGSVLDEVVPEVGADGWSMDADVGIVSLVGAGMRTHPGIASRMFETLATAGIDSLAVATSPIRVTCVLPAGQVEAATRALHEAFEVDILAQEREHEPIG